MAGRIAAGILVMFIAIGIANISFAENESASELTGRFAIKEFMPVVDPEMLDSLQVYICIERRIHRSHMLPSGEGGITKTRLAVRPQKKGSAWLMISAVDPAYRLYQVITRGYILPTLSWAGAEHIILGTLTLGGFVFDSDPIFPLHFKLLEKVGYVYVCGRGTVTTPDGQKHRLGYLYGVEDLIAGLAAKGQMVREASAEGLGWLAKTNREVDKAVPVLIKALKDHAMEVRRNAASSLGKIGDLRARDALKAALQDEDGWVREVAADALKRLEDKGIESLP